MKRGNAMRRCIFIAAIFLLAGAVVNVAVAWGCCRGSRLSRYPTELTIGQVRKIAEELGFQFRSDITSPDDLPSDVVDERGTFISGFGVTTERVRFSHFAPDVGLGPGAITRGGARRIQAGWPTASLCGYEIVEQDRSGVRSTEYRWALSAQEGRPPVGQSWGAGRLPFPCRPIWSGFLVNTVLYAVVVSSLIYGPLALCRSIRRSSRARRGLCPKCAYPMGESGVCSECGRLLPTRGVSFRSTS